MEKVDFHVHYDPLDESSAFRVIDIARQNDVTAIGLFVKSEISRSANEFVKYGRKNGIDVLSGFEYLSLQGNSRIDLIGIGIDLERVDKNCWLSQEAGRETNIRIALMQRKFLESKGFIFNLQNESDRILISRIENGELSEKAINYCNVLARINENTSLLVALKQFYESEWNNTVCLYGQKEKYLGRPDLLDGKFLYNIFFTPGREGFIPVQKSSGEVINLTHKLGGLVLYSPEGSFNELIWKELQVLGIDGIMAWHGTKLGVHENQDTGSFVCDISKDDLLEAKNNGLLILGGSDFDISKNHWQLGSGIGNLYISRKRYTELLLRLNSIRINNG